MVQVGQQRRARAHSGEGQHRPRARLDAYPPWCESCDSEPEGRITVGEVRGTTTAAYAALWQFLLSLDLVRTVDAAMASSDDPLRHLVADSRALHARPVDALWVRLVDVGAALSARR